MEEEVSKRIVERYKIRTMIMLLVAFAYLGAEIVIATARGFFEVRRTILVLSFIIVVLILDLLRTKLWPAPTLQFTNRASD